MTFHALDLVSWDGTDPDRPVAVVDVVCSAGTYVRALARDLGEALGSAAYLGALVRTASGPFVLEGAVPLDEIRAAAAESPSGLLPLLRPIDAGLDALPEITLTPEETPPGGPRPVRATVRRPAGAGRPLPTPRP